MTPHGEDEHLVRYTNFSTLEPNLKQSYQRRSEFATAPVADTEDTIMEASDVKDSERMVIEATGAVLTYNTAPSMLNHLCSLVPHDAFIPVPTPRYSGDFISTLLLPPSLPLPKNMRTFVGPEKPSKREAKLAVAFLAVKALHSLNVFDDYFLPVGSTKGKEQADADGRLIRSCTIPEIMDVPVRDPWSNGPTMWVHAVYIDNIRQAGVITNTPLPLVSLSSNGRAIELRSCCPVVFDLTEETLQRKMLADYTRLAILYCITGSPVSLPLNVFMVPILLNDQPDFSGTERLALSPWGSNDWSLITEADYGSLLVINTNQRGRTYLLRSIRYDLTLDSQPMENSDAAGFADYRSYYLEKWTKKKFVPFLPESGPLIELLRMPRQSSGAYSFSSNTSSTSPKSSEEEITLVPQGCCRWIPFSLKMCQAYKSLPQLLRCVTDIYRARQLRFELGFPPVLDQIIVEATTLPVSSIAKNNQRLETLGDAVLKLIVSVHVFAKFPFRHEGMWIIMGGNNIDIVHYCYRSTIESPKGQRLEHDTPMPSKRNRAGTFS